MSQDELECRSHEESDQTMDPVPYEWDMDHLEPQLTSVAARLSEWIYHLSPLSSEYSGKWHVGYDVLSIKRAEEHEGVQKAYVEVTLTQAHGLAPSRGDLLGQSHSVLVVVFRGSACLQDWLQCAACSDDRVHFRCFGVGVHSGIWTYALNDFLETGEAFLDLLQSRQEEGSGGMVLFTGHSMGGALASINQLVGRMIWEHPSELPCHAERAQALSPGTGELLEKAHAITFAAPMTFVPVQLSPQLEAHLQTHLINFVMNNDPVPRLPGEIMFVEDLVSKAGDLQVKLGGMAMKLGDVVKDLATRVPVTKRYRHLGTLILIQGDGQALRACGSGCTSLLQEQRQPTEGGGLWNWWSTNAYDASQDHLMERHLAALPWSVQRESRQRMTLETREDLDFSDEGLGNGGVISVTDAVCKNLNLRSLKLMGNHIGDVGASAVATALLEHGQLVKIDLSRNEIRDAGAAALAGSCYDQPKLEDISLRTNQVGDLGAKAFAKALKQMQQLTSLDLSDNKIGGAGAIALAETLSDNQCLRSLLLASNRIGDSGATALGHCLLCNSCLQELDLSGNRIGEASVTVFTRALQENGAIELLDLTGNEIGDAGLKALAAAACQNEHLGQTDCDEAGDTVDETGELLDQAGPTLALETT
eukprot:TRINITY_DN106809_c0_g1_i1.p1 TRINITY_DN106809_c0_g1~~TRINITY_DN106809_c0_g1_i1.p1  ORF type:complete len:647 (+),score=99.83 TRINITY_DN106809_c0_g1_i1:32-1972(+)